jgi:hypothetical protein
MKFKEWLLNEMPHMRMPSTPVNGVIGDVIDFRAEDRGKGLQSGNLVAGVDFQKFQGPWIARAKEGWLVHDGMQHLKMVPDFPEEQMKNIVQLPSDWWKFATVIDSRGVVKEPEWPRDDSEKLTAAAPQDLRKVV